MEAPNIDFRSAGFLVTRALDRPPWLAAELMPARMVSASSCIAPFVADTWCIEWTEDTRAQRMSCSWLCNGLDTVIHQGSRNDVGAEPGLWLPWLMIDHTNSPRAN